MRVEEDGESPTVVLGPRAHGRRRNNPVDRLPVCLVSAITLGAALICASALGVPNGGLLIVSAYAQSNQQNPLEKARTTVETLINRLRGRDMPEGIVKTNGRIEATEVDVAAKYPGRLATVSVNEGDEVTAGQVVGKISSPETEAQLRGAQAQLLKAKQSLAEVVALIAQRKSDLDFARPGFWRGKTLLEHGNISQQVVDQRRNKLEAAGPDTLRQMPSVTRPRPQSRLLKPMSNGCKQFSSTWYSCPQETGRVQYRLARAGEVVAAGQRVLTILDLNDVYMTIYLPANVAGPLMLGDEARTILDPIPQYVLPNTISFVATEAQFAPKSVETAEEREKAMLRVKLQADPQVINKYYRQVKTGVRGLGFVRTDPKIPWPAELAVKLP